MSNMKEKAISHHVKLSNAVVGTSLYRVPRDDTAPKDPVNSK